MINKSSRTFGPFGPRPQKGVFLPLSPCLPRGGRPILVGMKKIGLALAAILALGASQASANIPSYESSRVNTLFSGVLSGNYAGQAAGSIADRIPLIGGLSKLFSLEDEAAYWIERESARYARSMVREQATEMGLNPYYLSTSGGGSSSAARSSGASSTGSASKPKIRAHVSTHRVGLSLLVRF